MLVQIVQQARVDTNNTLMRSSCYCYKECSRPYTVLIMIVIANPVTGNSSKFTVVTKRGEFVVALSYTLRTKVWELANPESELFAANELAQAIVSRHDPKLPFQPLYIFAEHNSEPSLVGEIKRIRKLGIDR